MRDPATNSENGELTATSPAPPAAPSAEPVEIVEVAPDQPDDDIVLEYVILRNSGSAAVSVTGWSLGDTAGHRVQLPAVTIEGETYMWVWTGTGDNDAANVYLGRRTAMWDSAGGTALLLHEQGGEVARRAY